MNTQRLHKRPNTWLKLFIITAFALLSACSPGELNFQIHYTDVNGLKQGAALIHEKDRVGAVDNIEYSEQGRFVVDVHIDEAFRALAKQSTLFYISQAQDSEEKVIALITSDKENDSLIEENALIEGSSQVDAVTKKISKKIGNALESFSSSLQNSWSKLSEQSTDEQIDALNEQLDQVMEQLKDLSEKTKTHVQEHILPQLKDEINKLKKQLEQQGQEDEIEGIEEKLENIDGLIEA